MPTKHNPPNSDTAAHSPEERLKRAKGLFKNHLDAVKAQEWGKADAVLSEMRKLAKQHTDDAAVRECLAMVLFNAHVDVGNAQEWGKADALLSKLRKLKTKHPNDAKVREQLAKALVNAQEFACNENKESTATDLLTELRQVVACSQGNSLEWLLYLALHYNYDSFKPKNDSFRIEAQEILNKLTPHDLERMPDRGRHKIALWKDYWLAYPILQ